MTGFHVCLFSGFSKAVVLEWATLFLFEDFKESRNNIQSYWQCSIQLCRKLAWALLSFPYHRGTAPAVVILTRRHGHIEFTDSTNSPNWTAKLLFKAIFVQLQHRCKCTCLWSQMQIHSKGSKAHMRTWVQIVSTAWKADQGCAYLESQCWERAKENAQLPGQPV